MSMRRLALVVLCAVAASCDSAPSGSTDVLVVARETPVRCWAIHGRDVTHTFAGNDHWLRWTSGAGVSVDVPFPYTVIWRGAGGWGEVFAAAKLAPETCVDVR